MEIDAFELQEILSSAFKKGKERSVDCFYSCLYHLRFGMWLSVLSWTHSQGS